MRSLTCVRDDKRCHSDDRREEESQPIEKRRFLTIGLRPRVGMTAMERFANTPRTEKIEPRLHFGGRGYFLKLIDSDYRTMIFPLSTIRPFSSSVKLYMPERKRPASTDTLFFPASTVRLSTIRPAASDMYRCSKVLPPAALNSMVMASLGPARVGNTFMDPVFCTVFNPVDSLSIR